jgi:cell division protein FtsB
MDAENREEKTVSQPVRTNSGMIAFLVLTIIFFLVAVALGYLYYQKIKSYQVLLDEKESLATEVSTISELEEQISQLKTEKEDIAENKDDLATSEESWASKMEKIEAYNEVLSYLSNLLKIHGGFEDWTNAEYQQGQKLALATEDTNLVSVIDWAWDNKDINQVTRLRRVLDALTSGINSNLE